MTLKQHLASRHLDMSLHQVFLDEENEVATFPLFTLCGVFGGYQAYRPHASKVQKNDTKGRYYTFRPREDLSLVWGLESFNLSDTLFVTEGIFDACHLTKLGFSAVATLSNDPKHVKMLLSLFRSMRKVVTVCDNDPAGMKLAKYGHESFVMHTYKDLGDASDDFVYDLAKSFT